MIKNIKFLEENKDFLFELARKKNNYNENGSCTISKSDPDFYDDEWEKLFKKELSDL